MVMDYATAYERTRAKPYAETFRCPGGELCLDFCNTGQHVRGAGEEQIEWLTDFGELVAWLHAAGALSAKQVSSLRAAAERAPEAAQRVWSRALRFREALARVLIAKAQGRSPFTDDLQLIEQEYARSARYARLAAAGLGSVIALVRAIGVICQDKPHLSLHHPHALSAPPLPTMAFQ